MSSTSADQQASPVTHWIVLKFFFSSAFSLKRVANHAVEFKCFNVETYVFRTTTSQSFVSSQPKEADPLSLLTYANKFSTRPICLPTRPRNQGVADAWLWGVCLAVDERYSEVVGKVLPQPSTRIIFVATQLRRSKGSFILIARFRWFTSIFFSHCISRWASADSSPSLTMPALSFAPEGSTALGIFACDWRVLASAKGLSACPYWFSQNFWFFFLFLKN